MGRQSHGETFVTADGNDIEEPCLPAVPKNNVDVVDAIPIDDYAVMAGVSYSLNIIDLASMITGPWAWYWPAPYGKSRIRNHCCGLVENTHRHKVTDEQRYDSKAGIVEEIEVMPTDGAGVVNEERRLQNDPDDNY